MDRDQASIVVEGSRAGSVGEAWRLAWPTIVGNLAVTAMWTADTIFLGQVGKVELAAAGFGGVLIFTLYTFFIGVVNATNTFVSQAKGGDRPQECGAFAWQGLWISLAAGLLLLVAVWRFDLILALAAPDPDVVTECLRYSRVRLAGAFFVLGTFALQAFFRGIGDVKTPMRVAIGANVLNVALDLVLIFGLGPFPRLTTFGAGLATTIANAAGFAVLFAVFVRPGLSRVYATRGAWRLDRTALKRLLRVGTPMGLQFFGDMGSFSVFMALMGRLGTNQLAASQIAIQVLSFSFMPASGLARACTTLVGQYLGAGKTLLAQRAGWTTFKMTLAYTACVGLIFILAQQWMFRVFNDDPGVVAAGVVILPALALFQVFDGMQMMAGGALQGAGDTTVPMAVFIGSSWLVFLPLALLFAYTLGWGMHGAWWAGVIHFALVSAFLVTRWSRGRWKDRTI